MKKFYFIILILAAITLGGFIGSIADGSLWWLGYVTRFSFEPGRFIDIQIIALTFGITVNISIAQIIMIFVAIFAYYKTAPKLFG
ncbi:MAG: DUF4321 domain-containing protein [Ruminococcus sp.]|nr:DUF4321 domain-containing protein [Ruminococcus sp.]HAE51961.1 DUF4321 domain-containing protein [Ruminococcus sp.]